MNNLSPWIDQLRRTRPTLALTSNAAADVAVVGGGIAGVATAFFILQQTDHRLILLESNRIAQGASGHNGGQLVSYFERPIAELVEEFGLPQTASAQQGVLSAWDLLQDMYQRVQSTTPFDQFTGHAGYQDIADVLTHLEGNYLLQQHHTHVPKIAIAQQMIAQIPAHYLPYSTPVPHQQILSLLETHDTRYIAALSEKKGCLNSAQFCEDVVSFLLTTYPKRIQVYEHSHVKHIQATQNGATLTVGDQTVNSTHVVLCTNGYTEFSLSSNGSPLPHRIRSLMGYMTAYLEDMLYPPIAVSYHPRKKQTSDDPIEADPYVYVTCRTVETETHHKKSLISIGGPDTVLEESSSYSSLLPYPEKIKQTLDTFVRKTYQFAPQEAINYRYHWHGLMGYTENGIRCVGPEPTNTTILYNIGCNGVGLLPSVYGGQRVAQWLAGQPLEPSLFDPPRM